LLLLLLLLCRGGRPGRLRRAGRDEQPRVRFGQHAPPHQALEPVTRPLDPTGLSAVPQRLAHLLSPQRLTSPGEHIQHPPVRRPPRLPRAAAGAATPAASSPSTLRTVCRVTPSRDRVCSSAVNRADSEAIWARNHST